MYIAEYCSKCDKKTLRKTLPCPECTPEKEEPASGTKGNHYMPVPFIKILHPRLKPYLQAYKELHTDDKRPLEEYSKKEIEELCQCAMLFDLTIIKRTKELL